jgi:hypothetical protein
MGWQWWRRWPTGCRGRLRCEFTPGDARRYRGYAGGERKTSQLTAGAARQLAHDVANAVRHTPCRNSKRRAPSSWRASPRSPRCRRRACQAPRGCALPSRTSRQTKGATSSRAILPLHAVSVATTFDIVINADGGAAGIPRETLELVVGEGLRQLGPDAHIEVVD